MDRLCYVVDEEVVALGGPLPVEYAPPTLPHEGPQLLASSNSLLIEVDPDNAEAKTARAEFSTASAGWGRRGRR